jgi:cohesin complex subunit SA-1/2
VTKSRFLAGLVSYGVVSGFTSHSTGLLFLSFRLVRVAHQLTDGDIPIDKIRVHLTDYIVQSLREMPEHKCLATNWSAMLKAIRSENTQQEKAGREDVAKQRVLLRMLATAAELEVGGSPAADSSDEGKKSGNKRKKDSTIEPSEALSISLLKSLPHLLVAFKGDVVALRSLTKLPRYLIPAVFSLPTRKIEFQSLVKNLCAVFLESTDETVLQHIALSLSILEQGDHARIPEVKMQLKKLSGALQERLMELFRDSDPQNEKKKKSPKKKRKSNRRSDASESTESGLFSEASSPRVDVEHSILLCLLRWRIMTKQCPISDLFDEKEKDDDEIEGFCNTVAEVSGVSLACIKRTRSAFHISFWAPFFLCFQSEIMQAIAKRLQDRKPIVNVDKGEEDASMDDTTIGTVKTVTVPEIWTTDDPQIHGVIAKSVDEALTLLLDIMAWKIDETVKPVLETIKDYDDDSDDDSDAESETKGGEKEDKMDVQDITVLRMRDRLLKLLGLCFDQYIDDEDDTFSNEHIQFSSAVQASAGRVASDVRVLFPKDWSDAKDGIRRALALTDDAQLIGGFARYLQSREFELHACSNKKEAKEEGPLVNDLLLPLARGLTANWNAGSRREAGIVLAHITGSGHEATHAVQAMARLLKKVNPVRFLEAQMASLRLAFEEWVNNEPEELESDRPTEEEMNEYETAVERHDAMFRSIESQASRLSMSLGVGKLTDKKLSQALLGFVQEGVRFAFYGDKAGDDDLVLGSRLPFLLILSKYANWIKKNKAQVKAMKENIDAKEEELRFHPEFDEVHEDDRAALASFRESLGLKATLPLSEISGSPHTVPDDGTVMDSPAATTPSTSGRRRSAPNTANSQRSRVSVQSSAQGSLSPLYEEDPANSGDESPSPQKRRRLSNSLGSSITMSTVAEKKVDEGENEETASSASEEP